MDDIDNYLSRYTDRDEDETEHPCHGCGFLDCECDDDPEDCLGCGVCEWCIQRSIDAAEDAKEICVCGRPCLGGRQCEMCEEMYPEPPDR